MKEFDWEKEVKRFMDSQKAPAEIRKKRPSKLSQNARAKGKISKQSRKKNRKK